MPCFLQRAIDYDDTRVAPACRHFDAAAADFDYAAIRELKMLPDVAMYVTLRRYARARCFHIDY